MRIFYWLALAGLALLGSASPGAARVHAQMFCWALDSELPISCDAEDDEDDGEIRFQGSRIGFVRRPAPIPGP